MPMLARHALLAQNRCYGQSFYDKVFCQLTTAETFLALPQREASWKWAVRIRNRRKYRYVRLSKPPQWSRLKNKCIGVGRQTAAQGQKLNDILPLKPPQWSRLRTNASEWVVKLLHKRPNVQWCNSVQAAQMKSIEKQMYRSGPSGCYHSFPATEECCKVVAHNSCIVRTPQFTTPSPSIQTRSLSQIVCCGNTTTIQYLLSSRCRLMGWQYWPVDPASHADTARWFWCWSDLKGPWCTWCLCPSPVYV